MPLRIEILFNKFIAGDCTRQEYDELMDLLRENQHEEAVRQMLQQVYQSTARSLKSVTYVDNNGQLQTAAAGTANAGTVPLRRYRYRAIAVAAAAMLILGTGGWWLYQHYRPVGSGMAQGPAATAVHRITQRGEMKYLALPDGTQVWLNVASTLDFPEKFAEGKREVYLSGEAFFDVKQVTDQPFLIHTGNVMTRVLGTSFNIKAYPGQPDVIVSVKRGKVQVSKNDKVLATLTMGQEATVAAATERATVDATKENMVAAWTAGHLSYTSRPISDILEDLERNYNISIVLADSTMGAEIFTTSFRKDIGEEEALDIICKATDTRLVKENGIYIIKRN